MTGRDLADVLAIERVSFPTPWSERTFRNLMRRANARLWVAESGAGVLGYAVAWFAGPEAELGGLAVTPEARRRGIGRTLVKAVLEDARSCGIRLVFLEVRESNAAARRLYERAGFETVGRRPGYYVSPVEDALVMSIETA
jgi:ribosomal-protein-alanine N-acetyltransferase